MRIILANLIIFGLLALLYFSGILNLFSWEYMGWVAGALVVIVFAIGFKVIGLPKGKRDKDRDREQD